MVLSALKFRDEIFDLYKDIFEVDKKLSFRELLAEMEGKSSLPTKKIKELALLKAKCNIYETLLIKNFKSVKSFERMIDSTVE